jgi:hypothetical protein
MKIYLELINFTWILILLAYTYDFVCKFVISYDLLAKFSRKWPSGFILQNFQRGQTKLTQWC